MPPKSNMKLALLLFTSALSAQITTPMPINGAITLSWPATTGQYVVDRVALDPAGPDVRLTPGSAPYLAINTFTDTTAVPGTSYVYRVQMVPPTGSWIFVGTFTWTAMLPTITETPTFSYPNGWFLSGKPAKGVNCTVGGNLMQPGKDYVLNGSTVLPVQLWSAPVVCIYVEGK